MPRITKLLAALAALALSATALAACSASPEPEPEARETVSLTITPTSHPAPSSTANLPDWAQEMSWIIYPPGFECAGTEGCGNDYVLTFGAPGEVLPENVEHYDPAVHVWVKPAAE